MTVCENGRALANNAILAWPIRPMSNGPALRRESPRKTPLSTSSCGRLREVLLNKTRSHRSHKSASPLAAGGPTKRVAKFGWRPRPSSASRPHWDLRCVTSRAPDSSRRLNRATDQPKRRERTQRRIKFEGKATRTPPTMIQNKVFRQRLRPRTLFAPAMSFSRI